MNLVDGGVVFGFVIRVVINSVRKRGKRR